jgi:hypothetical protein
MRTRKVLPEHLALPRIIGVVMEDVAPGQKLPTAEALSALELIKLSVEDLRWQPRVVDLGGGLPHAHTTGRDGKAFDTGMDLPDLAAQIRRILGAHPFVEELWLENGRFVQTNFHNYPVLLMAQMPKVETIVMPSGGFWGGVGEPTIAVAAPAVLNAIFAATGRRIRDLPIKNQNLKKA